MARSHNSDGDMNNRFVDAPTDDLESRRSALFEATKIAQRRAALPDESAWVSANAGAGKTHVLKTRVQRLLLSGVAPSRILCLTYTNAAAAEMSKRVFDDLAKWSAMDDLTLANELTALTGVDPDPEMLARARQLFARVIDAPGGLTIRTIHGFCERLLQRFPLEAGLTPGFKILDDETASTLQATAVAETLLAASRGQDPILANALKTTIAYAADDRFRDVISATRDARFRTAREDMRALEASAVRGAADRDEDGEVNGGEINGGMIDLWLRTAMGIDATTTPDAVVAMAARVLDDATLRKASDVLQASGKTTDATLADQLSAARKTAEAHARISALASALLTKDGEPRKPARFITKAVRADHPEIANALDTARDTLFAHLKTLKALQAIAATTAIIRLADRIAHGYAREKNEAGALDFDDLIAATRDLLAADGKAAWVLYKLDGGLDHILVDEAQDTSARQWQIIQTLAGEFFSGSETRDAPPTVFGVGDEKQSIYSFQGAQPKLFATAGRALADQAVAAGSRFNEIPLTLSFRTTAPILEAVDRVFDDPQRTPGVGRPHTSVRHNALRMGEAGCVELWPLLVPEAAEEVAVFDPLSGEQAASPVVQLARQIATTIRNWLDAKTLLPSQGRPIRPGDIMVLLRRRKPFGQALVSELKRAGVPVAGADRLALIDHIAIQDLMAVADFVTLPEDDLALAALLKSPLFDFNDDVLIAHAPNRKGSLWSALVKAAATQGAKPDLMRAVETLKNWRAAADRRPPFEFFARLLDDAAPHAPDLTMRQAILRRLGPDAADPLDEFLERALAFDDLQTPSLQGFVHWMRTSAFEIKRDMDQGADQVRIMTAHGAKGLEANIVFLPDTTSDPAKAPAPPFVDLNAAAPQPLDDHDDSVAPIPALLWPVAGAGKLEKVAEAKAARQLSELAEHNRLLYVAMTRARDQLIIAGIAPKRANAAQGADQAAPPASWYGVIHEKLFDRMTPATNALGQAVQRMESPQLRATPLVGDPSAGEAPNEPRPDWAFRPVPAEPIRQIPIQPSRLAPLETDAEGDPVEQGWNVGSPIDTGLGLPAATSPRAPRPLADPRALEDATAATPDSPVPDRFLRGNLTHALLQLLPELSEAAREDAGLRFLTSRGAALSSAARRSVLAEVLAILREPALAGLFAEGSRAEVSLIADIEGPKLGQPPLRITGQIDRLVERDDHVLIVDYKTNRDAPPPHGEIPQAYLLQLAAYRLALRRIFPDKPVRAALLWTIGPRLRTLSDQQLDAIAPNLWTQAARSAHHATTGDHSRDQVIR